MTEREREKCGIGGSIPSRQGGVREARRFDSTQVLPGSGTFWSMGVRWGRETVKEIAGEGGIRVQAIYIPGSLDFVL